MCGATLVSEVGLIGPKIKSIPLSKPFFKIHFYLSLMSVKFSKEIGCSGEVVFQNHTDHSQRKSVDHGGNSSIASQLRTESVTH